MKAGFYPKLAWSGIRKNSRLHTPYLLTCIGMVMMYYIINFLAQSQLIGQMRGGGTITGILGFGSYVIAAFSLIFLFYTNSFLIRRRKKEFGLYNILGMGKRNIGKILFWETLITAAIALLLGSAAGIAVSKLAELGLVNIMRGAVDFSLTISLTALKQAALYFSAIFLLIFLNNLRQVRFSNPAELLKSESAGEKPPKANWFFGFLGVLLLGAAYTIAVSIEDPISAMVWFFIAVIMVILASYFLFISGSVVLCRILQKKKSYYYKANHFVSVSSMVYRMKRNGAGLASICILATMVLVMIASTTCLYFGAEDSLRNRYPRNINLDAQFFEMKDFTEENIARLRKEAERVIDKNQISAFDITDYRFASVAGLLKNGEVETDVTAVNHVQIGDYSDVVEVYLLPLSDYNHMMGTNEVLASDQVLLHAVRTEYQDVTFSIKGGNVYRVKKQLDDFIGSGHAAMNIIPSIFVVLPDYEAGLAPLAKLQDYNGNASVFFHWNYGFDTDASAEVQESTYRDMREIYRDMQKNMPAAGTEDKRGFFHVSCESASVERGDFYATYGGLFFLGIILSIVFIFAAVLIIYYKQISEGYEDQARFDIMQKVGMSKHDIRKSINSQLLTVFFLPLIGAGLHLSFAFPMIHKLLMLFNLNNVPLLIGTTAISFLVFALFYTLVYRITSNAYYAIVSGVKEEKQ